MRVWREGSQWCRDVSQFLDGAFERVNRAGEHLADLRKGIAEFRQAQENAVLDKLDPQDFRRIPPFGVAPIPLPSSIPTFMVGKRMIPPPRLSVLVGECIYNLRAALDYLAHELARLDSGRTQKGTQFPIVDTEEDFSRRRNTWLKGINDAHVACIERYQPYKRCDWTKTLRDISNPDKHRTLTALVGESIGFPRVSNSQDFLKDLPSPIRSAHDSAGQKVYVQFHIVLEICLADERTLVTETLEVLKLKVAETLTEFKPEFKWDLYRKS